MPDCAVLFNLIFALSPLHSVLFFRSQSPGEKSMCVKLIAENRRLKSEAVKAGIRMRSYRERVIESEGYKIGNKDVA